MSEMAVIGIVDEKALTYVYCPHRVDICNLGALLQYKYNTVGRVEKLISKGDIYILGESMSYKGVVKRNDNYFYPTSIYYYEGRAEYIVSGIASATKLTKEDKIELLEQYSSKWNEVKPKKLSLEKRKLNTVLRKLCSQQYDAIYLFDKKLNKWFYVHGEWKNEQLNVEVKSLSEIFNDEKLIYEIMEDNGIIPGYTKKYIEYIKNVLKL